ncbi:MAG: tRNA pseudouridine(38-40) synthase TruA [Candidatus Omnitrophota bacterium]
MRNIKLTIQYDGTNYSGWQFQKNAKSIQEVIQDRIGKITGHKSSLKGSGRTDAGVHAMAQVANFRTPSKIPLKNLQMALNSALPKDIVISHIEEVQAKFNAQYDAKGKLYCYTLANNDFVDPFMRRFAAKCFYKLDVRVMRKAAAILVGKHDFKSFQATDGDRGDSIRTIKRIAIEKHNDIINIYMEADGFLYNMARCIAGTLVEAGRGKINVPRVREILRRKERRLCGPTMPAKGLCLVKVMY